MERTVTDEQIAEIRAEALAGRLLARLTLQVLMSSRSDAERVLDIMSDLADQTLDKSPAVTPGNEVLDNHVLEVARIRIQQDLAAVKAMLPK